MKRDDNTLKIEVWADIVCPWCYVGKRHLEAAIDQLDVDVEIVWRSYELDPGMALDVNKPLDEILSKKYRVSLDEAKAMQDRMASNAADQGLCMNFEIAKTGNTFDAHRLVHFAQSVGKGEEMTERLMVAYFTEGIPISDREALVALAVEIGLTREDAHRALESGAFGGDVREDEAQALEYGIRGVPFFLIDEKLGVSGAQPAEVLVGAIERALTD